MDYPTRSAFLRTLTARDFCTLYGISKEELEQLIRAGRINVVKRSIPMQVCDPIWAASFGLCPVNSKHIPMLQCGEVAEILGLTPRAFRHVADQGEIPFHLVRKRRLYTVAALRQVLDERERREQGRRNSGIRPWLVEWARQRLRTHPSVL